MSRVLAFQAPRKPVLRGQAHFWAVMRSLDFVGPWTLDHVLAGSNADRSTLREYVRRLLAGGFVSRVAFEDRPEQHYRIARQQSAAPVVRRDGTVGLQGRGQQQMWNVIRGPIARGGFTFKDVALYASTETVSVGPATAQRYVGHLAQAGYLAPVQAGKPGRPASWRLKPAMNTGPKPPLILQAHVVFDQNRFEAVGEVVAREVEP